MAEIHWETGVLPRDLTPFLSVQTSSSLLLRRLYCLWREAPTVFTCRGPAVRVRAGGEGEIPGFDALAGEIHRLPGGFLLPDVQPLPSVA
jgi:hypothetical protein